MTVHPLAGPPPPGLAAALATFERQFVYPLGPGRSFRISHGDDYTRFLRSMGDARCFVAERAGAVLGTLGVAVRRLRLPGGATCDAAYVADLKVDAAARRSVVMGRLVAAAVAWARPRVTAAYGVVMDGTAITPATLTDRLGVPAFARLGRIDVYRLPTGDAADVLVTDAPGEASTAAVVATNGDPALRSETEPRWLSRPGASGRLEDTRPCKRLTADDGGELRSAHLARFAWDDPAAAAAVVAAARHRAAAAGFPAMFVAVPHGPPPFAVPAGSAVAGATVYGVGLPTGLDWAVDTSEI